MLLLKHDEVQEFVVHLAEEDRPFTTHGALRVVVVENEEFPALFAGSGEKIGTRGLEALEDFDIETTGAGDMEDLSAHAEIMAQVFYHLKGSWVAYVSEF